MSDDEQAAQIISIARELYAEAADISDHAHIDQEQGGCWVAARVWVPNVYIEEY